MASTRVSSPTPSVAEQQAPSRGRLFPRLRDIRLSDLTSKKTWLGDYDYAAMFSFRSRKLPFFGPEEPLPVVLALVLGLQHALAMVGGLVVPPLLLGGGAGAALDSDETTYLVSSSLIWCALGTCIQVSRIPLGKGYFIGTGVLNVIGTSFAFVSTGLTFINNQYSREDGMCSYDADGNKVPCREAFGALLGSASTVAIIAVFLSFTSPRYLRRMFTPLITGAILLTIGLSLLSSGMTNWAGGSSCQSGGFCTAGRHTDLTYGSPRLIGLGFSVWISIILFDLLGPPLIKNLSTVLGLLVGIIISASTGYFTGSSITSAPVASFLWVKTFPLSVRGELILPFLASYLVVISEGIGNITATASASLLPIEGPDFASRIQGGLLSDTLWAALAGLATVPPSTTFSQNISIIALSNNASRLSGYTCAMWLFIMGIFAKFGAVFVAMPSSVIGGLTVFLFSSVAIAGLRILATVRWTRRARFIATAALSLGFSAIVSPDWFENFFTYSGSNHALRGFLDALTLIVSEGYLITLVIGIPLQWITPLGEEDLEAQELEKGGLPVTAVEAGGSGSVGGNKYRHELGPVRRATEEMMLEPVDSK
ncbi:hypothetical protein JCM8547_001519 [Rhodosporidiobolus lusitaniae]